MKRKPLDFEAIRLAAQGRFLDSIFPAVGISFSRPPHKHQPCPICGGRDRFRCDNKRGSGSFICSNCKAGDGFRLISLYTGRTGYELMLTVAEILGIESDTISETTRAKWRQDAKAREIASQKADEQARQAAYEQANHRWHNAQTQGVSEYCNHKQIPPLFVRFENGAILVPVVHSSINQDGVWVDLLVNLQTINANGDKRFIKGGAVKGCYCPMVHGEQDFGSLMLCEGYATGMSLYQAFNGKTPVFAAFNAANLVPVGHLLRHRFPNAHIIICADDDADTAQRLYEKALQDGKNPSSPLEFNAGIKYANETARAIGATVITPKFDE